MSPAKKKTKSRTTKESVVKKTPAKKAKPAAKKKPAPAKKAKAEKKKPAAKAKPAKGPLDRAKETVKKGVAAIAKSMKSAPSKAVAEKKKPAAKKALKVEKPPKQEKAPKQEKLPKKEKAAATPRKKPANVRAATPIQTTQFGNKYICFDCQAKFYDLNRPDPICPKCGANQHWMPKGEVIKAPKKKPAEKKSRAMSTFYDDDEVASEEVDTNPKDGDLGFEDEFLDEMSDEEVTEEEEEL